jgi:hypothetical protein
MLSAWRSALSLTQFQVPVIIEFRAILSAEVSLPIRVTLLSQWNRNTFAKLSIGGCGLIFRRVAIRPARAPPLLQRLDKGVAEVLTLRRSHTRR